MAKKRSGYLEWDEYFMGVAFLAAQRSKDPSTQVGACIVNGEKKIVAVGYNGFPIGCSDDSLPWSKTAKDRLDTKYPYVCHAELNAIVNKNSSDVRGCVMYVTLFPCNECAKLAIQAGISKIIYLSDKHHAKPEMIASRKLFDMVAIAYERFVPRREQVVIDYEAGMREEMERSMLVEGRRSAGGEEQAEEEEEEEELAGAGLDGEEAELAPVMDGLDESVCSTPSVTPPPTAVSAGNVNNNSNSDRSFNSSNNNNSINNKNKSDNQSNNNYKSNNQSNNNNSSSNNKNLSNDDIDDDDGGLVALVKSSRAKPAGESFVLNARVLARVEVAAAAVAVAASGAGKVKGVTAEEIASHLWRMDKEEMDNDDDGPEGDVVVGGDVDAVRGGGADAVATDGAVVADGADADPVAAEDADADVDADGDVSGVLAMVKRSVEFLKSERLLSEDEAGKLTLVRGKRRKRKRIDGQAEAGADGGSAGAPLGSSTPAKIRPAASTPANSRPSKSVSIKTKF